MTTTTAKPPSHRCGESINWYSRTRAASADRPHRSGPLAEIAARERQSRLAYLAEVLAVEVDDDTERRRTRP